MNTDSRHRMPADRGPSQFELALERARELVGSPPRDRGDAAWSALAGQVGDVAVLALALGD